MTGLNRVEGPSENPINWKLLAWIWIERARYNTRHKEGRRVIVTVAILVYFTKLSTKNGNGRVMMGVSWPPVCFEEGLILSQQWSDEDGSQEVQKQI